MPDKYTIMEDYLIKVSNLVIEQRSLLIQVEAGGELTDYLFYDPSWNQYTPIYSDHFFKAFIKACDNYSILNENALSTIVEVITAIDGLKTYFESSSHREIETYSFINRHLLPFLLKRLPAEEQLKVTLHIKQVVASEGIFRAQTFGEAFTYILFENALTDSERLQFLRSGRELGFNPVFFWDGLMSASKDELQDIIRLQELVVESYTEDELILLQALFILLFKLIPDTAFHRLKNYTLQLNWAGIVIDAFSANLANNEILLKDCLDLSECLAIADPSVDTNLASLYINIWRGKENHDSSLLDRCRVGLFRLVSSERVEVQAAVIQRLILFKNDEYFAHQLCLSLLSNPKHSAEFYLSKPYQPNILDSIYTSTISDTALFFEFIQAFGEYVKATFEVDRFYGATHSHYQQSPIVYVERSLQMLHNDKGRIRLIGNKLLDSVLVSIQVENLHPFLSSLSEINQIKLILSIYYWQSLDFPRRFRLVLPLFSSQHLSVVKLLLRIIDQDFEKYPTLLSILRDEIPLNFPQRDEVIELLTNRNHEYIKLRSEHFDLKELSPRYTQAVAFDYFFKKNQQFLSARVNEQMKNKTLIGALGIKTVQLVKGGAWKLEGRDEISPLGEIKTSFQIPAAIYQDPDAFKFELSIYYSQNWSDTVDWQQWLKKFSFKNI